MNWRLPIVVALLLAGGAPSPTTAEDADSIPFALAHARFEQNATDGDVEAIFEVIGRRDGLTKLKVVAPDGRAIIDFTSAVGQNASQKAGTMGMRQFTFETPEPTDIDGLKASCPAGEYTFTGTTAKGATLHSKAKLDHTLPATTSFIFPKHNAKKVPTKNVLMKWAPVEGVDGYIVELEDEEATSTIEVKLPASITTFAVPEGFLVPEQEYQFGVGTVFAGGNISYIETNFTTAAAPP